MIEDSDRVVLEEREGEIVEIRGIANVTVPSRGNSVVRDHMQSIGGRGNGPVQVIQNDEVVGVVHHINISDRGVQDEELREVLHSIQPGDIVRYVGRVCRYRGYRGIAKYDVKEVSEIEIL